MTSPVEQGVVRDIRNSLRNIEREVHGLDERIKDSDARHVATDHRLLEIEGRYATFEAMMRGEHMLLQQKIDTSNELMQKVDRTLTAHTQREDKERSRLFWLLVSTLVSVLTILGTLFLNHLVVGGTRNEGKGVSTHQEDKALHMAPTRLDRSGDYLGAGLARLTGHTPVVRGSAGRSRVHVPRAPG